MGSMKGTINRLNKMNREMAKAQSLEDILFAGRQQYHNTGVSAFNAETHALKVALQHAYDRIDAQDQTIAELMMEINQLKALILQGVRKGTVHVERTTITEKVDIEYDVDKHEEFRKQYCKGVNIMWTCGIPPVDIAFNEFDIYRKENGIHGMITPEDVRRNWSTLALHSKKITGMTLGRLLKEYARTRGLNY